VEYFPHVFLVIIIITALISISCMITFIKKRKMIET
jgi:hypothetical protein